jgi:small GTP-binding protein
MSTGGNRPNGAGSPGPVQTTYKGKVVVVGDYNVGKTCFSQRFITKSFSGVSEPTIGAAFQTRTMPVNPTTNVVLELWDTAGSERYRSLMPMYYRDAYAAVVGFDLTDHRTFEHTNQWLDDFRKSNEHPASEVLIVLIGTKYDLATEQNKRQVTTEEAKEFAESEGVAYFETSARTDYNVLEVFSAIAQHIAKVREHQAAANQQTAGAAGGRGGTRGTNNRITLSEDSDYVRRRRTQEGPEKKEKCQC